MPTILAADKLVFVYCNQACEVSLFNDKSSFHYANLYSAAKIKAKMPSQMHLPVIGWLLGGAPSRTSKFLKFFHLRKRS